jgi:hypothetical protein
VRSDTAAAGAASRVRGREQLLRFLGRRLAGAVKSMLAKRLSGAHARVKGALSSGLSIATVASSASSAFLVGMFAGFGLQFLRLIGVVLLRAQRRRQAGHLALSCLGSSTNVTVNGGLHMLGPLGRN